MIHSRSLHCQRNMYVTQYVTATHWHNNPKKNRTQPHRPKAQHHDPQHTVPGNHRHCRRHRPHQDWQAQDEHLPQACTTALPSVHTRLVRNAGAFVTCATQNDHVINTRMPQMVRANKVQGCVWACVVLVRPRVLRR